MGNATGKAVDRHRQKVDELRRSPSEDAHTVSPINPEKAESETPSPARSERIEELAYQFWEERGRPLGSPGEDWLRAEKELFPDKL